MTPFRLDPSQNIFQAPSDPAQWPAFRAQLAAWRDDVRSRVKYDDALYAKPEFAWSASAYVCYFLMMYDAAFYDAATGRYTVDALLDHVDADFGGCDSVVLWHAYPRIGVDERNQFDFYRDMPGGLAGVRAAVDAFHARGVRVYINYNPWDRATRREAKPDADMLAEFVAALDVDGIFLDTMARGDFREKLDAVRPGVVLEGENTPTSDNIFDHHASWAQWFDDSAAPGVLRHKWMERRHMQHQTQRWNSDHTAELHTAWMNGTGMMLWENVFGAWVPWNARDRSLLRAMTPIQSRFTTLFSGEGWTPLVPTEQRDVYASLWTDGDVRLWTLVNRSDRAADGRLLAIDARPGERFFDLIAGREIRVEDATSIVSRGVGCIVAMPAARVDADFEAFLARQAATDARFDADTTRPYRDVRSITPASTRRYAAAPEGMIAATFNHWTKTLATQVRERECGFYDPNVSDAGGFRDSYHFRTREFIRPFAHRPFAFDETPVTNAEYAEFLRASGYRPRVADNFLRHWRDGAPPAGKLDHPVVWIDLDDARAYAAWAGKRLPTEDEWQYAAQNSDGREYPWHGGMRAGVCNLGETRDTTPVRAFPAGRNSWGGYDFCGNVWQWTESEATEGRTRFCMIRGGSYFCPTGTNWYVDGGPRATSFSTKFLLMSPSLDRCATIGFRCVVDLVG